MNQTRQTLQAPAAEVQTLPSEAVLSHQSASLDHPGAVIALYSGFQQLALVLLRVVIGWHFLYEGYLKAADKSWTSAGYLLNSRGPFRDTFVGLARSPEWLGRADTLVVWGLIILGLALIMGLFSRWAAAAAILMLSLFYLANPPWPGVPQLQGEGNFIIVNKNVVEIGALLVILAFPTSQIAGLDLFLDRRRRRRSRAGSENETSGRSSKGVHVAGF